MRAEETVTGEEHLPFNIHLCLRKEYHVNLSGEEKDHSPRRISLPTQCWRTKLPLG